MLTISKEQLADLPIAHFSGRSVVIDDENAVDGAIADLRSAKIIGFDTETRPSFKRGQLHKVALLQLSTYDTCYLFRLNHLGLTDQMVALFEDESIVKVGLSTKDDIHSLHKLRPFEPASMIELQSFVKDFNIADNSLQKVFAIIFGQRVSKGQRLTNWEAEQLTEAQQAYASLDAQACLMIYDNLREGRFIPEESPYKVEEPAADVSITHNDQRHAAL